MMQNGRKNILDFGAVGDGNTDIQRRFKKPLIHVKQEKPYIYQQVFL